MRPTWKDAVVGAFAVAGLTLFSAGAFGDDLDVTMRMVTDDDSLTDSVVREIELTRPIMLDARPGNSEDAKEARENGREFGQSVAEQAREAARLRKENKFPNGPGGSGSGRPESPDRPDSPGSSGNLDRPDNLSGQSLG